MFSVGKGDRLKANDYKGRKVTTFFFFWIYFSCAWRWNVAPSFVYERKTVREDDWQWIVCCYNAVLFYLFFYLSFHTPSIFLLIQQKKDVKAEGGHFFLVAVS